MVLIILQKNIYDITDYISKHPGEGICNVYLRFLNRKDATAGFHRYHNTNEPEEILQTAIEKGNSSGVVYVCPSFFKRRIPKHFHYFKDDPYGIQYIQQQENATFFLRKSNSDPLHSISVTYKDSKGNIGQLKITKVHKWYAEWEDEDGEPVEIYKDDLMDVIREIFSEYTPV